MAAVFDIDADVLLKRILTNLEAEQLFNLFHENKLEEVC